MPKIPSATLQPTTSPALLSTIQPNTAAPPATESNLGPQPTACPSELQRLFSSSKPSLKYPTCIDNIYTITYCVTLGKNNGLVVGLLIFFVAVLVLLSLGITFYHYRGGSLLSQFKETTGIGNVAYVREDNQVSF